ncbi:MAG: 8-amino-7-oxononanoate synthase [Mucilaginibacter polytrichastri]|nr:8-amino-7-oxononanoate synthase [Mucilaginibacter polytrichastri]
MPADEFMQQKLQQRKENGLLRSLRQTGHLVDFSSNDYLGFAHDPNLQDAFIDHLQKYRVKTGSSGSRLLTGNSVLAEELENDLEDFFLADAALLFNSGYDANVGLLSSLPQRGDTVITDELSHASIIDGVRLSHANRFIFKHNDLHSLEQKLKNSSGNVYVVVESVYSMDGDRAPLLELISRVKMYGAQLIVDEAHAIGISRRGLVAEAGLENAVFARVITFGKALGSHGAAVLGPNVLRNYLINFARSFIYTTAQSPHNLVATKLALQQLGLADNAMRQLHRNITFFRVKTASLKNRPESDTAIQQVIIPGNARVREVAKMLGENGFDVRPIVSPTVAAGQERLRICLHSFNTEEEIARLSELLCNVIL